jgi:N utilization substance protein B
MAQATRRRGREAAVQLLYASDVERELDRGQDRERFWELCTAKPKGRAFAEELVDGVLRHLAEIDRVLEEHLEHFELGRLAAVDRNVLRLAIYELRHGPSLPAAIVINEAIEIAKEFGTSDSGRFVNGVLDRIHRRFASGTADTEAPA